MRRYRATAWDTPRNDLEPSGSAGEMYRFVFQVPAATWQNGVEPLDVTGDGLIVPLDALTVINELNLPEHTDGVGRLLDPPPDSPPPFLDVNGDGYCTSIDALFIINRLNNVPPAVAASSQAAEAASSGQLSSPATSCSAVAAAIDCLLAEEADEWHLPRA